MGMGTGSGSGSSRESRVKDEKLPPIFGNEKIKTTLYHSRNNATPPWLSFFIPPRRIKQNLRPWI